MKSKAATWVIRVLAVLLIISFAAWGIEDMIVPSGLPTDVAEVGSTTITANQFNDAFRRQIERLRRVLGPDVDSEQARQLGVAETTLEGLISQRLLDLHANEKGLLVGDDQVLQQIHAEPAFRGPGGSFDRLTFESVLSQQGISEQRYVQDLREQIKLSHLTGVIRSATAAPDTLARSLYHYRNDKRVARFVEIPRPAESTLATPDDGTLTDFHKKNPARFTAPERRDLTALHLSPADVAAEIQPSEEDLRAQYEDRLEALSIPERRRISQIVVDDEAKAKSAQEALRSGRDIAEVAKSVAGMDADAVKLGLLTEEDLPEDLAKAAFSLPARTPGAPVRSPVGWHVLIVEEIQPGKTPSFGEARPKLREELAREQAVDALVKLANQVEDTLAGGATIEEAAAQVNAKLIKFRAVEANGRSADGEPKDGLLVRQNFLDTAFETEETRLSDLTETALGGYFLVRVDQVTPPTLEPFDKIRDAVAAAWRQDRLNAIAKKRADKILGEVEAGRGLDDVAREMDLGVKTSAPFTRFEQGGENALPSSLAAALFRSKPGGAVVGPTPEGFAVAVLNRIEPADPSADKAGLDGVRDELKTAMATDLLTQYTRALRKIYPVSIDAGALDRLFDGGGVRP